MSYSIEWSDEAETTYIRILLYLEEKWTIREVRNFMVRTEEVLGFINKNPMIYPHSAKHKIHRAVVTTQVSLYYEVHEQKIILLSFSDNRQHPDKRKF